MANELLLRFAAGLQQENDVLGQFATQQYQATPFGVPVSAEQPQQQAAHQPLQQAMPQQAMPQQAMPQQAAPQQQAPQAYRDFTTTNSPNRGFNTAGMSSSALSAYDALSQDWGQPLNINSAYRDPTHNARVGGARGSQHTHGNAIDIDVRHLSQEERTDLIRRARKAGFRGVGVYANSLHFDTGPERAWGPNYSRTSLPEWAAEAVGAPVGNVRMSTKSPDGGNEPVEGQEDGTAQPSRFDMFLERIGMGPAEDPDPDDDDFPITGRERLGNILEAASEGFGHLSQGTGMDLSDILQGQAQRREWALKRLEERRARRKAEQDMRMAQETFASIYADKNPDLAAMALASPEAFKLAVDIADREARHENAISLQSLQDANAMGRLEITEAGSDRRAGEQREHEVGLQDTRLTHQTAEREGGEEHDLTKIGVQHENTLDLANVNNTHTSAENQLNREAQTTLQDERLTVDQRIAGLERGLRTRLQEGQQNFTAAQNGLDRSLQEVLQDDRLSSQEKLAEADRLLQGTLQTERLEHDTAEADRQVGRDVEVADTLAENAARRERAKEIRDDYRDIHERQAIVRALEANPRTRGLAPSVSAMGIEEARATFKEATMKDWEYDAASRARDNTIINLRELAKQVPEGQHYENIAALMETNPSLSMKEAADMLKDQRPDKLQIFDDFEQWDEDKQERFLAMERSGAVNLGDRLDIVKWERGYDRVQRAYQALDESRDAALVSQSMKQMFEAVGYDLPQGPLSEALLPFRGLLAEAGWLDESGTNIVATSDTIQQFRQRMMPEVKLDSQISEKEFATMMASLPGIGKQPMGNAISLQMLTVNREIAESHAALMDQYVEENGSDSGFNRWYNEQVELGEAQSAVLSIEGLDDVRLGNMIDNGYIKPGDIMFLYNPDTGRNEPRPVDQFDIQAWQEQLAE